MLRVMLTSIALLSATTIQAQTVHDRASASTATGTFVRPFPGLGYSMTYVPLDYAYAINNSGVIAGSVGGTAALFSGGSVIQLQTPAGYSDVRADDIAHSGRIVGSGMNAGARRVLYWENAQSVGQDIGAIARYMFPQSINSRGEVVGYFYTTSMDTDLPQGFKWSPTTGITIITPWGATQAQPFDISETGYVAGVAWYSGIGQQAVRWWPYGGVGRITGPAYGDRAYDDGSILGMSAGLGSTLWNLSNTATPAGPAPATHLAQHRNGSNRWVGYTVPGAQPWTSVGTGAASYLPLPSGAYGYAHDVNACGTILGSIVPSGGVNRPVYWSKMFCDNQPIFTPF